MPRQRFELSTQLGLAMTFPVELVSTPGEDPIINRRRVTLPLKISMGESVLPRLRAPTRACRVDLLEHGDGDGGIIVLNTLFSKFMI